MIDWLLRNTLDHRLRRFKAYRKWRGLPEPMSPEMALLAREAMRVLVSQIDAAVMAEQSREWEKPKTGATIYIRKPARFVSMAAHRRESDGRA